jgi:ABC-type phosphate transport system ATPase subunit
VMGASTCGKSTKLRMGTSGQTEDVSRVAGALARPGEGVVDGADDVSPALG